MLLAAVMQFDPHKKDYAIAEVLLVYLPVKLDFCWLRVGPGA